METADRLQIALGGMWFALEVEGAVEPRQVVQVVDGDSDEATALVTTGVAGEACNVETIKFDEHSFWRVEADCETHCRLENERLAAESDDDGDDAGDEAGRQ